MAAGSSGWPMVVSSLGGVVAFGVAFTAAIWLQRRRRLQLRERPPQSTKLLRPPGYALQQRLETVNDQWLDAMLVAVGSASVFGVCSFSGARLISLAFRNAGVTDLLKAPGISSFVAITLASLCFSIFAFVRMVKLTKEARACRLGLRGEQAVAEALADPALISAGYRSFHDVPGDGEWNIDHVVVGPAGVFVLETKARPRKKAKFDQEEHVVKFDGKTLQFPWCEDHEAAEQAQRNAESLWKLIGGYAPEGLTLQPILVMPGWFVDPVGKSAIKAMNAKYLVGFLTNEPPLFKPEALKSVLKRLDECCRTVEF